MCPEFIGIGRTNLTFRKQKYVLKTSLLFVCLMEGDRMPKQIHFLCSLIRLHIVAWGVVGKVIVSNMKIGFKIHPH